VDTHLCYYGLQIEMGHSCEFVFKIIRAKVWKYFQDYFLLTLITVRWSFGCLAFCASNVGVVEALVTLSRCSKSAIGTVKWKLASWQTKLCPSRFARNLNFLLFVHIFVAESRL
jgi:hypothetical protein